MFKNRPFEIDYRMNQVKPIAVILAVSVSQGVDLYMSFEKSVDQKKFCQFLRRLRKKYPDRSYCFLFHCLFNPKLNELNPWIRYDPYLVTSVDLETFLKFKSFLSFCRPEVQTRRTQKVQRRTQKWKMLSLLVVAPTLSHGDGYYMISGNDGGQRGRKSCAVRKVKKYLPRSNISSQNWI